MAEHRGTLRAARPVLAGAILTRSEGGAVRLRARQYIMPVRFISDTVADLTFFGEVGLLGQVVAGTVESGDVPGDHHALDVLPWSLADAVARIDGGLAVGGLRREIGVPDLGGAKTRRLRQRLAVVVGAGDAAEIAAIADATAGQEERGIGGLRRSWRGRQKSECNGDAGRDGFCGRAHLFLHLAACGWGFAVCNPGRRHCVEPAATRLIPARAGNEH